MQTATCLMCGNAAGNSSVELREMMYASLERFDYMECASCGSLQIGALPDDLSRFYPKDYYSFRTPAHSSMKSPLRSFLRRKRTAYRIFRKGWIGKLITPPPEQDWFARAYTWDWFRHTATGPGAKILDVGCGAGALLFNMRDQGFEQLTGVDPFLGESIFEGGIRLFKGTIHDLDGKFDLVMAHHSLEHMQVPRSALERMRDLCHVGGWVLVRIPVLGDSWRRYGDCWVELDAPRHLFIPSVDGLRNLIAGIGGLELKRVEFDTMMFEIAGSELYARGIPLRKPPDGREVVYLDHFSSDELAGFKARAEALNAAGTAGRAAFYMQRVD